MSFPASVGESLVPRPAPGFLRPPNCRSLKSLTSSSVWSRVSLGPSGPRSPPGPARAGPRPCRRPPPLLTKQKQEEYHSPLLILARFSCEVATPRPLDLSRPLTSLAPRRSPGGEEGTPPLGQSPSEDTRSCRLSRRSLRLDLEGRERVRLTEGSKGRRARAEAALARGCVGGAAHEQDGAAPARLGLRIRQ